MALGSTRKVLGKFGPKDVFKAGGHKSMCVCWQERFRRKWRAEDGGESGENGWGDVFDQRRRDEMKHRWRRWLSRGTSEVHS